jgi:hypothetical protein
MFVIVMMGRVVDILSLWLRLVIASLVLLISQINAGFVVDTRAILDRHVAAQVHSDETAEWFDRLERRILSGASDQPVVFVTASGGGSRAALFAGLVFEHLAHVGFDGRPAPPEHSIASNIALISGVSGGSLATARFLAPPEDPIRDVPRGFIVQQVATGMAGIAKDWGEMVERCQKKPDSCESFDDLDLRKRREDGRMALATDASNLRQKTAPAIAPWLFQSALVDDMTTDFMAPLLRGALTPLMERGQSVAGFWSERFKWTHVDQRTCPPVTPRSGRIWTCDWSSKRPPPLVMLNATNVKTGRRVVIGYPPVPGDLLGGLRAGDMTSLSDYGGAFDLTLADGVRLSANFPWGFEIGFVDTSDEVLGWLRKPETRLKLTDGGVTDNSGIDTVAKLLERLEALADPPRAGETRTEHDLFLARRAHDLGNLLLARGLMLIEIDSGAHPSPRGPLARFFPVISDPWDAMNLGEWGSATTLKKGLKAHIIDALSEMAHQEDRPSAPKPFRHLEFECNHTETVMTAWALGPKDKATIMDAFLVEAYANRSLLARPLPTTAQTERAAESEIAAGEAEKGQPDSRRMAAQVVQDLRRNSEEQRQDDDATLLVDRTPSGGPTLDRSLAKPASRWVSSETPHQGWVYLGAYDKDQGAWRTAYFSAAGSKGLSDPVSALRVGQALVTKGRVNVRFDLPDDDANFAPVKFVLPPGTKIKLSENPKAWADTGFYWAAVTIE